MGYQLSVSGDSLEDLKAGVAALCGAAVNASGPADTAPKKGPGRPAKTAQQTTAEAMDDLLGSGEKATEPAKPAAAPPKVYTETEVRAKLQELMAARTGDANEQAGIGRVKAALAKVGAEKIKDVPAAKYAELVQYIELT